MRGAASGGLAFVFALSAACLSVQDFGASEGAPPDGGDGEDGGPSIGDASPPPEGTWRWEWINPAPTGATLLGIGGTSDTDVWVAGEGGNVAHFDGARWDIRHAGPPTTRYFSVGTKSPNDVWVAGADNGQTRVVHYDGKAWVDSYPFAGGAFRGFSHGTGKRLFAIVDWSILELSAEGKWESTDTLANDVWGAPVDVWVSPSGESWALLTGVKLMRLPAGSKKWQLEAPPAGIPSAAVGIALAGAGSQACAFYTGRSTGVGGGGGFLRYDGSAWQVGPSSTEGLTIDPDPHGSKSACLSDGTGLFLDGDLVYTASMASSPGGQKPSEFPGERLLGALSLDGSKAYAVGARGAFLTRASGSTSWQEKGPTIRKDLLGVDVGLDGTVMLVDALSVDRNQGGEVLFWQDAALKTKKTGGLSAPSLPKGIAVIDASDVWVVAEASASVGVSHFTGSWGVTRILDGGSPFTGGTDPLAIWAPAKNDVWVTGREGCPSPLPGGSCAKTLAGFTWHYDGKTWTAMDLPGVYRSIHGTAPNDVWLAGDGVAHWDGKSLEKVASLTGSFTGVWSSAKDRVWLWGDRAVLFDGKTVTPIQTALSAAADWNVQGVAESKAGDVFVLTKRATGTTLLWFDPSRTRLVEQITSEMELTAIRGRGDQLWAIGEGGAALRFAPQAPR